MWFCFFLAVQLLENLAFLRVDSGRLAKTQLLKAAASELANFVHPWKKKSSQYHGGHKQDYLEKVAEFWKQGR